MTTFVIAALALFNPAHATPGDCVLADGDPFTASCNAVCDSSGTTITCDLGDFDDGSGNDPCEGGSAKVVWNYAGDTTGTEYTAFGSCNQEGSGANRGTTEPWCCTFTDPSGSPFEDIDLYGTGYHDKLMFLDDDTGAELSAPNGDLTATIFAGDGDDYLVGSPSTDSSYTERLKGQGDADFIDLKDGADGQQIGQGGSEDDVLVGADAQDILAGGAGNDILVGGAGDDTLCEVCPSPGDALKGGDGDDKLWAGNPLACAGPDTIDGGDGVNDDCGASNWDNQTYQCEGTLTSAPPACP